MLSHTSKYALRALIYLARFSEKGKMIGIKKIAEDLHLSAPFLGKILQFLVREGLLVSVKGPNGGFNLAKEPDSISLWDVVVTVDGEGFFTHCLLGLNPCHSNDSGRPICPVHRKYARLRKQIIDFYQKTNLQCISDDIEKFEDFINL
jgi:Rrf2 family transcriptional regulator, iron-sulfur cluster assembly transcription factor